MLHVITGRRKLWVYLPRWVADAVAPLAEMYYRILKQAPLYTRYSIETLSADNHYSHEKVDLVLGYGNRPMKDTLKDTYEWLMKTGRIQ
jgi:dihydroflavonol-4-reductase